MTKSELVYVALGGNLGDRSTNLARARDWLARVAEEGIVEESQIFETAPVGPGQQMCHLNQVVRFRTVLTPEQLLVFFKEVEHWLGRVRRPRMYPREIDIDLLFYGESDINLPHLRIPHPAWSARAFVLVPLLDLEPEFTCPLSGVAAQTLLEEHCPHWAEMAWLWRSSVALTA
jgi:2-amino-4-hydroxy-6-hydroxymethyldihydropteridine diphosphokinase